MWITYRPGLDTADVQSLRPRSTRSRAARSMLSPYPGLPAPVVVTVWNAQLDLNGADDPRLPISPEVLRRRAHRSRGGLRDLQGRGPHHGLARQPLTARRVPTVHRSRRHGRPARDLRLPSVTASCRVSSTAVARRARPPADGLRHQAHLGYGRQLGAGRPGGRAVDVSTSDCGSGWRPDAAGDQDLTLHNADQYAGEVQVVGRGVARGPGVRRHRAARARAPPSTSTCPWPPDATPWPA